MVEDRDSNSEHSLQNYKKILSTYIEVYVGSSSATQQCATPKILRLWLVAYVCDWFASVALAESKDSTVDAK